ncbi:hypothetical protein FHS90_000654 [Rufibacter quisquiliarum]|uniref:Uncharacterized protein n=1 Tax=Rufibacter quisquiliarum TaxID=1549639 RepID=A0A839GAJ8_9BACT|nr:hypothetical protein [Rufibacter quisquiliarum]
MLRLLFRICNPEASTEGICNPRICTFERQKPRIGNPQDIQVRDLKSRTAVTYAIAIIGNAITGWCQHPLPPSKGEYLLELGNIS